MANPKKSRRHRSTRRRHMSARRHKNPFAGRRHRSFSRRRRHNPSIAGFSANELIKLALGAAGGTLATKYATQLILQDKNQGALGYGVMAAVAVALGWASKKFLGPNVAVGVVAGGASAVVLRIFQEQVSGSVAMSGLGDPDVLGEYTSGTYPVPGWSYGAPALPAPAAAMAAGAPAAAARSPRSAGRS